MNEGPRKTTSARNSALSGAEFAGIGVQFALTMLVFAFAGLWLDKRFHSSPWLLVIFVFAGAGGGFFSMYRRIIAAQRREERQRKDARK